MSPETVNAPELDILRVPEPESMEKAPNASAALVDVIRQALPQLKSVGGGAAKASAAIIASSKQLARIRCLSLMFMLNVLCLFIRSHQTYVFGSFFQIVE